MSVYSSMFHWISRGSKAMSGCKACTMGVLLLYDIVDLILAPRIGWKTIESGSTNGTVVFTRRYLPFVSGSKPDKAVA